ncbi:DgyrCDS1175 [Dimorphilus gyrociliatus]|uniref:DgyrCDS1175 n=1 Tax=Dimorphilus gyrociliatus TaxID=2664684 RepID=A0A7I8V6N1_9ANNE|nr:DgyrCDS1175 [Dimorphilus gyrociliatus]
MKERGRILFVLVLILPYLEFIGGSFVSISTKGCGSIKGCYRMPPNCNGRNCLSLITFRWHKATDTILFEMQSQALSGIHWTSVGFSDEAQMGDNYVVDCLYNQSSSNALIQRSWNYLNSGGRRTGNRVLKDKYAGMDLSQPFQANYSDGFIQCTFSMHVTTTGAKYTPNFKSKYYLLLARGPTTKKGVKHKHTVSPFMSPEKMNLLTFVDITGLKKDTLVLLHGSFMLIAWLLLGSSGMLVARYCKSFFGQFRSTHTWFLV